MKVVVDNKIPYIQGQIEQLADEVVYLAGAEIDAAAVADADILIIRTRTRCDASLLEHSTVRFIVTATIGFDHLDTDYLDRRGITWTNCAGCNAMSVVQYVRNSLLTLHTAREWKRLRPTAAVVGVGHVGKPMAEMLKSLGMTVLQCDPPRRDAEPDFQHTDLSDIAAQADIITFHTPLTHTGPYPTFHLADEAFFQSLQHQPILVNAARGEVVDNQALLRAIRSGQVSQTIIDTWEGEPNLSQDLLREVYIGTPHIAGYSADGKANATRMALEAVSRFVGKQVKLSVNPPVLPRGFRYGEEGKGALRLYDPRVDSDRLKAHPEQFEQLRGNYPLRRETAQRHNYFKIGVIVLALCIPCYIFSFAQMLLPLSAATKTVLWVVFFGLAKAFQYGGIAILGVEGYKRVKSFFKKKKAPPT